MVKLNNGIKDFEFTIGADPEFFVEKNGKVVSAHGLIPGDKKRPFKVEKGAVQVDGMALEFNIDPAKDQKEFLNNLDAVMNQIMEMVPDYKYYDKPVADFGLKYIQQQPEEARVLGCEPDWNAYTMEPNPRPNAEAPFRTASGHIHMGWTDGVDPLDPGHLKACGRLARMLDYTLGIPSLAWDTDRRRRELYGKAGCFRPKPYGMEYRTLSNAWLTPVDNPEKGKPGKFLRKYVYHQAIKAVELLFENADNDKKDVFGKSAKEIIDTNDEKTVMFAFQYDPNIPKPSDFR